MSLGSKPSTARILDPVHASLSGQAKVNAEIFTAVEILGRKLERVEEERDRLARRLALIESAATLDEKTGKFYLPVVVDRPELPPAPPRTSRWMIAASLMSSTVALFALGVVLLRDPMPALTKDQIATLNALSGTQFAQLSSESNSWKNLDQDTADAPVTTASSSTPRPDAQLPDNAELAKLEQSAENLNAVEPAASDVPPSETMPEVALAPTPAPPPATEKPQTAAVDPADVPIPGEDEPPAPRPAKIAVKAPTPAPAKPKAAAATSAKPVKRGELPPDASLTGKLAELEKRAYQGMPEAQHDIATLYAAGSSVPQDYKRATYWFNKAAENGIANADYNLGVIYHQGLGTAVDMSKALKWYEKAADLGHPEAMYNLGIAYIEGIGTKANTEKGVAYFKRAAKAGVAQAAYNLGVLYESSFVGPADARKAIEWYAMAAKQGHEDARKALSRLNADTAVSANDTAGDQARALAEAEPAAGGRDDDAEEVGQGDSSPVREAPRPSAAQNMLAGIQQALIQQGILPGRPTGVLNQQTEDAIRSAQRKLGMVEDGQPSHELLEKLLQKPPLAR